MDWLKSKVNEITLTAAVGLAALQIIMPMFLDLILDGLIIGLMLVASKTSK